MITYTSLIALSERGLPLKELGINKIPNIPTADIARRCSHALSCIPHLNTNHLNQNVQDANTLLLYLTGLTSVDFSWNNNSYCFTTIQTQLCHKLTKITVWSSCFPVADILSLCCANPLLQSLLAIIKVALLILH